MHPEEILKFINEKIREEHGTSVTLDSLFLDSELDSFGINMFFLELHNKYRCFEAEYVINIPDWKVLTIQDIVNRIIDENK